MKKGWLVFSLRLILAGLFLYAGSIKMVGPGIYGGIGLSPRTR